MVLTAWELDEGRQMKNWKMDEVRNMSTRYLCDRKKYINNETKQDTIPTLVYMSLGRKLYIKGTLL